MGKWYRINNEGKHKHPGGEGEINQVHSFMFLILGQNIYTLLYYTSILRYKAVCICVTVCMICVTVSHKMRQTDTKWREALEQMGAERLDVQVNLNSQNIVCFSDSRDNKNTSHRSKIDHSSNLLVPLCLNNLIACGRGWREKVPYKLFNYFV